MQGTDTISPTLGKYFLHSDALAVTSVFDVATLAGLSTVSVFGSTYLGDLLRLALDRLGLSLLDLGRERLDAIAAHLLRQTTDRHAPAGAGLNPAGIAVEPLRRS